MKPPRKTPARSSPAIGIDIHAAIALVASEYEDFLTAPTASPEEPDPRAFGARHAAARTALVHLDYLQRLAHQRALAMPAASGHASLLAQARRAIAQTPEPEEDPEADDLAGQQ